ncbi:MAG TPA: hypothetical protein VNS63_23575, partial [Blastocatellia bacterium]|nr:hypothetical protein [Blastocatellia bacterium]
MFKKRLGFPHRLFAVVWAVVWSACIGALSELVHAQERLANPPLERTFPEALVNPSSGHGRQGKAESLPLADDEMLCLNPDQEAQEPSAKGSATSSAGGPDVGEADRGRGISNQPVPDAQLTGNNTGAKPEREKPGFQWEPAVKQGLFFLGIQTAFRVATEPSTRLDLKGPFFKDYFKSLKNLRGWRDGDEFYVNYIGHPMQGAVTGFIQIQNDPKGRYQELGFNKGYWMSRLKATAWSTVLSLQFELGPVSEASLGNVGLKPSDKSNHPMAYVDLVVTPLLGTALLVAEDALDRFVIRRIEDKTQNRLIRILARSFLNPSRSFANML